jgi:uncharacterized cofD-like protein
MAPTASQVTVVGGGHGGARTLEALREVRSRGRAFALSAVVSTADDGGSSGRLRRDHDVVALGDLRMALTALATSTSVQRLAQHRYGRGELAGHSLGNLLLLGLIDQHDGDLLAALDAFAELLATEGRVLPATCDPVTLHARTADGDVSGQTKVARTRRIERVRLEPDAPSAPAPVVEALRDADLVLIGPGSLYTSILPALLVPEAAAALRTNRGTIVLIGNLREQPGETEGMDLEEHVAAFHDHVPGVRIDTLVAHVPSPQRSGRRDDAPAMPSARPLRFVEDRLARHVGRIVTADLAGAGDGHDTRALADVLATLITGPVRGVAVAAS